VLGIEALPAAPAIVTTSRIWRLHGRRISRLAGPAGPIVIGDGEKAKHLRSVERIYHALAARRVDRAGTLVAFGGGVVGDVAGFAAATFLRGIDFIQIPTTLVAQVDSAIGGKVGVNLPAGKNLAGAFHAPAMVLVDPALLRTLPPREFRAGLYEVIKYGVIASRPLFERVAGSLDEIQRQQSSVLTAVILECCRLKADVVQRDEREDGLRRILNFGHTVGHALEAVTSYRRFRHGEAVGWGMAAAARLSVMRGAMNVEDEQELAALLQRLGPRTTSWMPCRETRKSGAAACTSCFAPASAARRSFQTCQQANCARPCAPSAFVLRELPLQLSSSLGLSQNLTHEEMKDM
jgi:3-dehydroquinate synthase